MKFSKSVLPVGVAVAAILTVQPITHSSAASTLSLEEVAYEGFDYSGTLSNGQALSTQAGGSGWSGAWSAGCSMVFDSSGLTYAGLTTSGGKALYGSGCSINNDLERSLPRQASGVVYLQFLSYLNTNGGGTPMIRFFDGSTFNGAVGNNDGGLEMAILPVGISKVDPGDPLSSEAPISQLNLTIVRIDYAANRTDMWVNPNLSTFDYLNPVNPNATATSYAPAFDKLYLITRNGTLPSPGTPEDFFDEIKVMRVVETPIPEDPQQRPPDWIQQYARAESEGCRDGWSPSWAEWPNEGTGGFVCTQVLTWSHDEQKFITVS